MNEQKRFFLASLSCVAVGTVAEFMGARAWAGELDRQRPDAHSSGSERSRRRPGAKRAEHSAQRP